MGKTKLWDKDNPWQPPGTKIVGETISKAAGLDGGVVKNTLEGDLPGLTKTLKGGHDSRVEAAQQEATDVKEAAHAESQSFADQMSGADKAYQKEIYDTENAYGKDLAKLRGESEDAQKDAKNTYTNTIQPGYKNLMEKGKANSDSAMTLSQAMDPNNAVAQSTRGLYETQAGNEGRAGLADAGTLQALGAQNFAGQMGGRPMTGGQMSALMGQNMAQSGQAYSNTQRRIQNLRDQGLQKGFERTDQAYNQGLDAQNQYGKSIGNYEGASDRQLGRDKGFRDEIGGYSSKTRDSNTHMSNINNQVNAGGILRNMGVASDYTNSKLSDINGRIASDNANDAANRQTAGTVVQVGATAAGTMAGSPQAGAAIGSAANQGIQNSGNNTGGYVSPYNTTNGAQGNSSAPNNFVEPGAQNQNYGGLSQNPGYGLAEQMNSRAAGRQSTTPIKKKTFTR